MQHPLQLLTNTVFIIEIEYQTKSLQQRLYLYNIIFFEQLCCRSPIPSMSLKSIRTEHPFKLFMCLFNEAHKRIGTALFA